MGSHNFFPQLFRHLDRTSETAMSRSWRGWCRLYLYVWSGHGRPDCSHPAGTAIYGSNRLLDVITPRRDWIAKVSSFVTGSMRLPDLSGNLYRLFSDSLAHPFLSGFIPDSETVDSSRFVYRTIRARADFSSVHRICSILCCVRVDPVASGNSLLSNTTIAWAPVLGGSRDNAAALAVIFLWTGLASFRNHLSRDWS